TMLDILYEDEALIFVNKPAGIVVQRGYDPDEPVLLELAAAHTSPIFLMQRLDRGTSGVMFFSKRADVNARLTRHFELKRITKRYLAICEGELAERQTIDAPLARIGPISFGVRDGGRRAITTVDPLAAGAAGSLLSVLLRTGRTHQIRVHLAAIGHPLAGDWLYGERNTTRPMLHAAELALTHPLTNAPLHVSAPLPDDFLLEGRERGIDVPQGGRSDPLRLQLND
ncbi:MAG TPA: RluA family pseudouridine synthase, partial [Thermoanaerobaculia bacterium]|nr:RluA family pseudouridine synthase [Thermoanaerobaculia bacterium]